MRGPENSLSRDRQQSSKDGYQARCKSCNQASVLKWQAENREQYLAAQRAKTSKQREQIIEFKENNPCTDCGAYWPYYAMEFDHRPGTDKRYNVSELVTSHAAGLLATEIAKCDLVCSCCHRVRTHFRRYRDAEAA
jgi:hypothetical protein